MRIGNLILISAVLVMASIAYAEDEMEKPTTESSASEPTQPAATSSDPPREKVKPLEEFVPSEEVSVDRPVAFPTDI